MSVFLFLFSKNCYLIVSTVCDHSQRDVWFIESLPNSLHQQYSYSACKLSVSMWSPHCLLQKSIRFNSTLFPKWFTYILGYNSFSSFSDSVQSLFSFLVNKYLFSGYCSPAPDLGIGNAPRDDILTFWWYNNGQR